MYYPVFIVIGILFCIWFLLPFFTKRILNPGNITGISFSVLMILCGLLKNTVLIYFLLFCLSCALFFTIRIFSVIGRRPTDCCTVIVLGCRVYGTKASLMLEERLQAAISYLRRHPDCNVIVSGGKGDDEAISEAACMHAYLLDHGIPKERIFIEDCSTTTLENLSFSYDIIKKQGLDQRLALVSNEFHLYRSLWIAKKLGLSAGCIPARTAWWLFPTYFVREMLAIINEDLGLMHRTPKS